MRPGGIVKVHPLLGRSQELSQGFIATSFSDRELERSDKALGIPVVGRRAGSAHRELEALLQQELTSGLCSELLALVAVKNGLRNLKVQRMQRRRHQFRAHVVLESQTQDMPGAFPEREAASHFGSVRQFDLKNVGEHDLGQTLRVQLANQVRRDLAGLARIDVLLPLEPSTDSIFVHDPAHPVRTHLQQCCQFAVAQRIIDLVPLLDGHGDFFVLDRLFGGPIERGPAHLQRTSDLALAVGAIGPAQLVGQFHLLYRS